MIPIRNIYYMLSYAWNHVQESDDLDLSGVEVEKPQDLLGLVLARGSLKLLRRGIDRDYITEERELKGMRGRVAIDETVKRALRFRGEIACRYDELSYDVLQNRIVAATMGRLLQVRDLGPAVRTELQLAAARFPRVTPLKLSAKAFRSVVIHRNNRFYRFLLDVCRLVYENLIVEQDVAGTYRFNDFRRDEARMGSLFEAFIRNFLTLEQRRFDVSAPTVSWNVHETDEYSLRHLPAMYTDIVLRGVARRIIIDTKFYEEPLSHHYDVSRIRSDNLYQILAYVANAAAEYPDEYVEGMLLYASVGHTLSLDYEILGQRLRVKSVDLNQDWQNIHQQLLTKIGVSETVAEEAVT